MATAQARLAALARQIVHDDVCPELRVQATQLVMGHGNPNAEVVFIGEAPGENEDLEGRPFIGASGKFLNTMLEAAGMVRDDVYITNIVKYRPPNNRDPSKAEKAAFQPYLMEELRIIGPRVVITLGRHSMNYFLPGAKIGEVHGMPQEVEFDGSSLLVVPLYHPAYALFNGGLRQTLIDEFARVPEIIRQHADRP